MRLNADLAEIVDAFLFGCARRDKVVTHLDTRCCARCIYIGQEFLGIGVETTACEDISKLGDAIAKTASIVEGFFK